MGPMLMLEWVLVLLLAAVVLTNLAERLTVPSSLLAIAGAGLAFLPYAPQIRIEPELALALFVAPALLDAAFDTSPRGLRDNAIPVVSMAVVAVVLTTAAIAFLGWRFAGLPIAAAIALGAIVAPPDAVAANEVLRHLRTPRHTGQDTQVFLPIAAGLIAVGVGVNQLILNSGSLWRIAGSVVLILGGGFWMFFCASMGVMVFDSPSAPGGTYLNAVIPIAAPGLIAVVVGVGQLIWK
jgi:monovalent cation/hydrogen antiporter